MCDLRLASTDSIDFLEQARRLQRGLRIAVLTAFSPSVEQRRRLKAIDAPVILKAADLGQRLTDFVSDAEPEPESTKDYDRISVRLEVTSPAYRSVFLSYGGPDESVARAVYDALLEKGLKVFFFPESAVPGQRLHRTMSEGIGAYDRVVLLCSRDSLGRPGVLNEIEQVLTKEAFEGGTELLIPVTLDDFVFGEWEPMRSDLARQVRSRVIADFRNATPRSGAFVAAINRILNALAR